jgi:hypothetical protein
MVDIPSKMKIIPYLVKKTGKFECQKSDGLCTVNRQSHERRYLLEFTLEKNVTEMTALILRKWKENRLF